MLDKTKLKDIETEIQDAYARSPGELEGLVSNARSTIEMEGSPAQKAAIARVRADVERADNDPMVMWRSLMQEFQNPRSPLWSGDSGMAGSNRRRRQKTRKGRKARKTRRTRKHI